MPPGISERGVTRVEKLISAAIQIRNKEADGSMRSLATVFQEIKTMSELGNEKAAEAGEKDFSIAGVLLVDVDIVGKKDTDSFTCVEALSVVYSQEGKLRVIGCEGGVYELSGDGRRLRNLSQGNGDILHRFLPEVDSPENLQVVTINTQKEMTPLLDVFRKKDFTISLGGTSPTLQKHSIGGLGEDGSYISQFAFIPFCVLNEETETGSGWHPFISRYYAKLKSYTSAVGVSEYPESEADFVEELAMFFKALREIMVSSYTKIEKEKD